MRRAAAIVLAAAMLGPAAASAGASPQQETVLMDDSEIVYATPEKLDARLGEAKALGFDRVRVSVYWRLLAPSPDQKQKPGSEYPSSDPRFYGEGKWDRYDRIVALAAKHGLALIFSITSPAPHWATGTPEGGRTDVEDTYDPSAKEFGDFVTAVAARYSGTWRDESEQPALVPLLPPERKQSEPLPRVGSWSLWNEPNHGGWLTPQWLAGPGGKALVPASPRIYRGLVDSGYGALAATGHAGDQILLGETAPRGLHNPGLTRGIRPLRFVRELYCLTDKLQPYSGADAEARGCPAAFDAAAFVGAHPGLFKATGWAHHPYSLESSPRVRDASSDDATLGGIPRLTRQQDRIFRLYGQPAKWQVWMTEYGYQTDPPDPTIGVPWSRQADWLDTATYLAYRNPRIASMAQFLLVDDGPIKQYPANDPRHWGTFQSGLMTTDGKHKTSYDSFKRAIDVIPRRQRAGRPLRIFGQLRSAPDGNRLTAEIQFRARGSKTWASVARITVGNARGFLDTFVKARKSGSYRVAWVGDGVSRSVSVRVKPR